MNRRNLIAGMAASTIALLWPLSGHAAESNLPAGYSCADVRAAVANYGKAAVMRMAKRNGATREQIAAAEKCL